MYDAVSSVYDYPIAKSFGKIYSPTVELVVSFPMQVMLSQKRPPHEVRIDHISEKDEMFYIPSDTYAYTTANPYIMQFDKDVSIESFWLRLHRSPKAYVERTEGTRLVQVYQNSQVVAETTFLLTSDEWVLIKPSSTTGPIIGDTLFVQAGTDIDSIVVSWGDSVKYNLQIREMGLQQKANRMFYAWKVAENPDKSSEYEYSMQMAHIIIANGGQMIEDKVLLDEYQQREMQDKAKEEAMKNLGKDAPLGKDVVGEDGTATLKMNKEQLKTQKNEAYQNKAGQNLSKMSREELGGEDYVKQFAAQVNSVREADD